jgi:NAD(P)-dependent dehydrogenase (short-subunit alcohol dehydrogenase family)
VASCPPASTRFASHAAGRLFCRISEPEEIARVIAFAASPNNITGNELLVDGGVVKNV